jgi:hypothetical protein
MRRSIHGHKIYPEKVFSEKVFSEKVFSEEIVSEKVRYQKIVREKVFDQANRREEVVFPQEIDAQVFAERGQECRDRDAGDEAGQAEERPQRQESDQPETGNCDRALEGAEGRQEGSAEEELRRRFQEGATPRPGSRINGRRAWGAFAVKELS